MHSNMKRQTAFPYPSLLVGWLCLAQFGCALHPTNQWCFDECLKCEEPVLPSKGQGQLQIDEPCRVGCLQEELDVPPPPDQIGINGTIEYWNLSLEQALSLALSESKVMRDLGGTVLRSPASAPTVYDAAISYTDPRFGEEAALSAFDATFAASAVFEKNDRALNNLSLGTAGILHQDLHRYQSEIRKRTATGTQLALRHTTDYDFNNQSGNRFGVPSASWTSFVDAEVRQPLLQGAGVAFNRIAGPTSRAGGVVGINGVNGVLLARMRTDISLAEFEASTRDLVSNVENAYWDLYFAYYDLDAKKKARDASLALWENTAAKAKSGKLGSSISGAQETQVREQYWRFQAEVVDALDGRVVDGTRTNSGSSGGTFRSSGGVRLAERRLRLVLGLPINGHQLIKPVSLPTQAPVTFDWSQVTSEALSSRPELRKQRWRVKQQELQLVANRNFLLPRLDAIGRYRWRGMGNEFISQSDAQFASSIGELGTGDYGEWQLGVELEMPLGFRRAHSAVRNAELNLAREKILLKEQERSILYGLSNAVADVRRAFQVMQAQFNRWDSAQDQENSMSSLHKEGLVTVDLLLEAQRRLIESEIRYHQSRVEYALSLKNVHHEKGTLLDYNNIWLAEAASPGRAYCQLGERRSRREGPINYAMRDVVLSAGQHNSNTPTQVNSSPPVTEFVTDERTEGEIIELLPAEALPTPAF